LILSDCAMKALRKKKPKTKGANGQASEAVDEVAD
jgi:hypothetical protein